VFGEFKVMLGCLARSLLESVHDVYALSESRDIQHTMFEGRVNTNLQHSWSHAPHWLPIIRFEPALNASQLESC